MKPRSSDRGGGGGAPLLAAGAEDSAAAGAGAASSAAGAAAGAAAAASSVAAAAKPPRGTLEVELYGGYPRGGGGGSHGGHGGALSSGFGGGGGDYDDDYDDDELLLDWERHNARRWRLCGADCTWAMRFVPERFHTPPDWWWRLSRLQRRAILYGGVFGTLALLALFVVVLPAALAGGGGSGRGSSRVSSVGGARAPLLVDAGTSPYCSWNELYLPKIAIPEHYDLAITADPRSSSSDRGGGGGGIVRGVVEIALAPLEEPTPCLVLHAKGLAITKVELLVDDGGDSGSGSSGGSSGGGRKKGSSGSGSGSSGGGVTRIAGAVHNATDFEQVVLRFPEAVPLAPARVTLALEFKYDLKEALDGFYLSRYTDAKGARRALASTHFEALGARRAFPCFDEPAFKATWALEVTAPPAPWVVLSNMPEEEGGGGGKGGGSGSKGSGRRRAARRRLQERRAQQRRQRALLGGGGDLVTRRFQTTPPMSSYLVAFVIGELDHIGLTCAAGAAGHLPVSVWATPDRAGLLDAALDAACASVRALEARLGAPFELPKLDLVGIPNFAAGAMENYGLITYREARLLVDPKEGDVAQEFAVSTVVAHEVAHMWFGDLVTLRDWNELWLNEGFATYFEYVGERTANCVASSGLLCACV